MPCGKESTGIHGGDLAGLLGGSAALQELAELLDDAHLVPVANELGGALVEGHLGHDLTGQRGERVALLRHHLASLVIRRPCVEANPRGPCDERIVAEALVVQRIGNDEDVLPEDRVRTERHVARRLLSPQPHARREPLPRVVDEADERDGVAADVRRELRGVVELGRRGGVEEPDPPEGFEPSLFTP